VAATEKAMPTSMMTNKKRRREKAEKIARFAVYLCVRTAGILFITTQHK
jgi:hypothetical protein